MLFRNRGLPGVMILGAAVLCLASNRAETQEVSPAAPAAKSQSVPATPNQASPELKQRRGAR